MYVHYACLGLADSISSLIKGIGNAISAVIVNATRYFIGTRAFHDAAGGNKTLDLGCIRGAITVRARDSTLVVAVARKRPNTENHSVLIVHIEAIRVSETMAHVDAHSLLTILGFNTITGRITGSSAARLALDLADGRPRWIKGKGLAVTARVIDAAGKAFRAQFCHGVAGKNGTLL